MTTATTTLTGKYANTRSKTASQNRNPVEEEIFYPKEVILHHAVDVHDSQVNSKHNILETILKTLGDSLFRSLKSHFDVTYRK